MKRLYESCTRSAATTGHDTNQGTVDDYGVGRNELTERLEAMTGAVCAIAYTKKQPRRNCLPLKQLIKLTHRRSKSLKQVPWKSLIELPGYGHRHLPLMSYILGWSEKPKCTFIDTLSGE